MKSQEENANSGLTVSRAVGLLLDHKQKLYTDFVLFAFVHP